MMILLLLLAMAEPPKGAIVFDACTASHAKLRTYTVHIDVNTHIPGRKQQTQFDLSVSGRDALLRVREPGTEI